MTARTPGSPIQSLVRNTQVQLVQAGLLLFMQVDCFEELALGEGRLYIITATQVNLASLKVMRDGSVDPSKQQFKRLDLDVEEVQAEHRNQIVDESLEVHASSLVDFLTGHIVVTEVVDAESALEQWQDRLVAVKV